MKLLKVHIFMILVHMMDLLLCATSRPVSLPIPHPSVFIGKLSPSFATLYSTGKDNLAFQLHRKILSPEEGKKSMVVGVVMKKLEGEKGKEEKYEEVKKMIGSRPPSCTNKCYGCMPCEAIQVPAGASTSSSTGGGGMHYANYLPEGWKCKCGSTFYTP